MPLEGGPGGGESGTVGVGEKNLIERRARSLVARAAGGFLVAEARHHADHGALEHIPDKNSRCKPLLGMRSRRTGFGTMGGPNFLSRTKVLSS